MRPAVTTFNIILTVIYCHFVNKVLAKPGSGYGRAIRGNEWVPHVNFTTGKMCHSRLNLPPGYDRMRPPSKGTYTYDVRRFLYTLPPCPQLELILFYVMCTKI